MAESFMIQRSILTMHDAVPIRFVHHKSMDSPEKHILHINNYLEVYVYVRGNHKYIVENRIYELKRGDIILISPRAVHKALPMENCMYERFYLLVDERCLSTLALNPLSGILHPTACSDYTDNLISPDAETREQVLNLLYGISKCFSNEQNRQTAALGLVLQLLDICTQQKSLGTSAADSITPTPKLLQEILSYVAENTASIQTTTQIANAIGFSPQYLSSYFSKHIGTPLKIFIQAKKVALAKDLLDKGWDVTQACFDSGFNDCSYFIRVFKKYVGITPLRYRQSLSK